MKRRLKKLTNKLENKSLSWNICNKVCQRLNSIQCPEVEKWKGFTEKWDQFCNRKVQLKEVEKEVALHKDRDQKEHKSLAKREKEAQKEMNLLSIDMNELESKKQVICKEKEETEQKRALILSSVSNNLKLDDSTVQEEAFLTVKIARMQAYHNLIDFILSVMVTKKHVQWHIISCNGVASIISKEFIDGILAVADIGCDGKSFYTYDSFISATNAYSSTREPSVGSPTSHLRSELVSMDRDEEVRESGYPASIS